MGAQNGPESVPGRSGGVSGGGVEIEAENDETGFPPPGVVSLVPLGSEKGSLGRPWGILGAPLGLSGLPFCSSGAHRQPLCRFLIDFRVPGSTKTIQKHGTVIKIKVSGLLGSRGFGNAARMHF